jgi:tRNA pseudouridine32 synthase/23S rRNA pseudouridine746 synthase
MATSERITAPPTRHGVGPSSVALPPGPWTALIDFLAERFNGISRDEWLARMARGDVLLAAGDPATPDTPYRAHTRIHYYRHLAVEPRIPFDEIVLHQDDHLVVVDKPHFLPVMPAGRFVQETLLVRLKRLLNLDTLVPLHRIDRDTAGLVLFAVQPTTRDRYAALFRQRAVSKRYEALAPWRTDLQLPLVYRSRLTAGDSFMQMREVAGTPNAETAIELLDSKLNLGRYGLSPVTGKKHQLRAHMAALGIPIVNDRIYPQLKPHTPESEIDYSQPLQLLAKALTFRDPLSGDERHFESTQSLRW